MTCPAMRRAGFNRGSSGCAYGPRIFEQTNSVISLPSRLSKSRRRSCRTRSGRDGKRAPPQGSGVQPLRGVPPVLPVEETEHRRRHVGPVQVGMGRHPTLDGRIEVAGKDSSDGLSDQRLGDGVGVGCGEPPRLVCCQRVQRGVQPVPPLVREFGGIAQNGVSDGSGRKEVRFVGPPHHRFARVSPDDASPPCRLGDATQAGGAFRAVPSLIADFVEQASLDADPGLAVCPGSHGPALTHHRAREETHLQRPRDAIQNLVNRLYA